MRLSSVLTPIYQRETRNFLSLLKYDWNGYILGRLFANLIKEGDDVAARRPSTIQIRKHINTCGAADPVI